MNAAGSRVKPPQEIERVFQTSLYLLIVTGFATLAGTGNLDTMSVVGVGAALVVRGWLLLIGRALAIPEKVTSYLTLIYMLVYVTDFYFLSQNFVTASVHLVLFAMVIKVFSIQRDRDYVYLTVLSFVMVLSAAILTVDSIFLAAFAVFVLLAVFCFMAFEMRRSALTATNAADIRVPPLRTKRRVVSGLERLSKSLGQASVAMLAGILAVGTILFFLLPRVTGGYLSRFAQQSDLVSGFSDTVSLGEIGRIQQSSQVVAHVKIEGDHDGGFDLRLRGTVLSVFDGQKWSTPPRYQEVATQGYQHSFNLHESFSGRGASTAVSRFATAHLPVVVAYRVLLEPIGTNVLFTIPTARSVQGNFREISTDMDQSLRDTDRDRPPAMYMGSSDVSQMTPVELDAARGEVPPDMPERYLGLAKLDPRIVRLARDVTAREKSNFGKAAAIERHLSTHYAYTLQLPSEQPADPLADFLFHRRRGHCEYFASAMVVMLRSVGIPARIVTGFHGSEFNKVTGSYIVRARDAHSWVEAYIAGAGWATFDPTPAGPAPPVNAWTRMMLYMDAAREFWREWVVNYDASHQSSLASSAMSQSRQSFDRFRMWAAERYRMMQEWARRTDSRARSNPQRARHGLMIGLALLAVLIVLPRLVQSIRISLAARNRRGSPQRAATVWYARMTRVAARRGHRKLEAQTPAEFAAAVSTPSLGDAVRRFTTHFERARYGNSAEDAERLPELLEQVKAAK